MYASEQPEHVEALKPKVVRVVAIRPPTMSSCTIHCTGLVM